MGLIPRALTTDLPLVAAPMAGGPTTPRLVLAAAEAGGLGVLAGGYRTADDLAAQIATVRAGTDRFGVNVFVPNPVPVSSDNYRRYRDQLRADSDRLGVELPERPREDDDHWRYKIDVLLDTPVPVVSFTFGLPGDDVLASLRAVGSVLVQTVTSVDEAEQATAAGVDALAVQAVAAGGHSGTWTPGRPLSDSSLPDLVGRISTAVGLPLLAAGGVSTADDVRAALSAGATAVMVGTALLLAAEAGTSNVHRAALRADDGDTVVTRCFTGRPARALPNGFVAAHDRQAPLGYPALHHLTSPLRKAAAAAGDRERVHLWAGTGYREIRAQPLAKTFAELTP